ncbi:MAG: prenyltransferase/squalene oxidase repeat-containing protein [Planctomycetota bacterium]
MHSRPRRTFFFPRLAFALCAACSFSSVAAQEPFQEIVFSETRLEDGRLAFSSGEGVVPVPEGLRFAQESALFTEWSAPVVSDAWSERARSFSTWTFEMVVLLEPFIVPSEGSEEIWEFFSLAPEGGAERSSIRMGLRDMHPVVEFRSTPDGPSIELVSDSPLDPSMSLVHFASNNHWKSLSLTHDGKHLRLHVNGHVVAETKVKRQRLLLGPEQRARFFDNIQDDGRRRLHGSMHSVAVFDEAFEKGELFDRSQNVRGLPNNNFRRAVRDGYFLTGAGILQAQIDSAIDRAVAWLSSQQVVSGEFGAEEGNDWSQSGRTELAVLALLHAGIPEDDERIQRAVQWVLTQEGEPSAVLAAQRIEMFAALEGQDHLERLRALASELLEQEYKRDGHWRWSSGATGPSLSATYPATVALFAAQRRGVEVDSAVWRRIAQTLVKRYRGLPERFREPDRSGRTQTVKFRAFRFLDSHEPTVSSTAAALSVLNITQRMDERLAQNRLGFLEAQEEGLQWLHRKFLRDMQVSTPSSLYDIERLGSLLGIRTINDVDWYREGATRIVDGQWDSGQFGVSFNYTCHGLLFLDRSTRQVVSDGPTTGASVLGVVEQERGAVKLRVSGQESSYISITGFDGLQEILGFKPHRARWYLNGQLVQEIGGQPGQPVFDPSFGIRRTFGVGTTTAIHAEVDGVDERGEASTVSSSTLLVER